jgi:hypothetical protein
LAEEIGILSTNTRLSRVGTDREAVDKVRRADAPRNRVQIAVCDPIAGDIGRNPVEGGLDQITLAGTMITGVPLWLCNTDPTIQVTADEQSLRSAAAKLEAIISYTEGTTSRVFAARLKDRLAKGAIRHIDCEFGKEWDVLQTTVAAGTFSEEKVLILTADVIRVVATALTKEHLVFDYHAHTRQLKLDPYLFTGILCRRSALQRELLPVLEVIHAMSAVVRIVRNALAHGSGSSLEDLLRICQARFPLTRTIPPSELDKLEERVQLDMYRRTLSLLMAGASSDPANLYRWLEDPPNEVELWTAWRNAEQLWQKFPPANGKQPLRVDVHRQATPIPSLLIAPSWDSLLQGYYQRQLTRKLLEPLRSIGALMFSVPTVGTYALAPLGMVLAVSTIVTRQLESAPLTTAQLSEAIGKLVAAIVPLVLMFIYVPRVKQLALTPEVDRPTIDRSHPVVVWLGSAAIFLGAFIWVYWGLR